MVATKMTLKQFMDLPNPKPAATYMGEHITGIMPDPAYPLEERYIIRIGFRGIVGKMPDTGIEVWET